jgi:hypothetical protein
VVDRQRAAHDGRGDDRAVGDDGLRAGRADGEDAGPGRVDDRGELGRPYMPRLETVNVPPSISSARSCRSRARLLLRAAEDLAGTTTLVEVRRSVRNLVTSDLKPSYVGLILVDGQELRRIPDPEISYHNRDPLGGVPARSRFPNAHAVRTGEIVAVSGPGEWLPRQRGLSTVIGTDPWRPGAY